MINKTFLAAAAVIIIHASCSATAVTKFLVDGDIAHRTTVSYKDLVLSSSNDRKTLQRRIAFAAYQVCAEQPREAVRNCELFAVKGTEHQLATILDPIVSTKLAMTAAQ